jgi:DNA-directed RNA polymerase beta subunit
MDHTYIDSFFNEHGYLANLDICYEKAINDIVKKYKQIFNIQQTINIKRDIHDDEYYYHYKKTKFLEVIINDKVVFEIPDTTKRGNYILNGIDWTINSMDIIYSGFPYIQDKKQISMMNKESGGRYAVTSVFANGNVYLSSIINIEFIDDEKFENKNYEINAYSVYFILCQKSVENFVEEICSHGKLLNFDEVMDIFEDFIHDSKNKVYNNIRKIFKNQEVNQTSIDNIIQIIKLEFFDYPMIEKSMIFNLNNTGTYIIGNRKLGVRKNSATEFKTNFPSNYYDNEPKGVQQRINMLTYCLYKLLIPQKITIQQNNLINRRIDTLGFMITRFYIDNMLEFVKKVIKERNFSYYIEDMENMCKKLGEDFITNLMKLRVTSYFRPIENMNVETLSKRNLLDEYSHVRRIKINSQTSNPDLGIRELMSDHYGFFCASETSDSSSVGLIKYFAITTLVSIKIDYIPQYTNNINNEYILLWNGYYTGRCSYQDYETMISHKQQHKFLSVSINKESKEIYVYTDQGRVVRPMYSKKYQKIMFFDQYEIFFQGNELEEIIPYSIFGLAASVQPFANHNQAARILFQTNMSKQTVGHGPHDFVVESRTLWYGEKDAVYTHMSRKIYPHHYNGFNVCIAMYPMGFNQDDAIVFKKSSVERGLFAYDKYYVKQIEFDPITNSFIRLCLDRPTIKDIYHDDGIIINYYENFRFDEKGIIKPYMMIEPFGIIGTLFLRDFMKNKKIRRNIESTMHIGYYMKKYFICDNIINIEIFRSSLINIGDKFASRSAQKGVVSRFYYDHELPYNKERICPDIIINPHSIPSRMTIGHMLETWISKLSGFEDYEDGYDASAFRKHDYDKIKQDCIKHNIESEELLYCPDTSKEFGKVLFGFCYYTALKHQVEDKMFMRNFGPVEFLTRQPTEGKAQGGGLRLGNMEIDAMLVTNITDVIQNLLVNENDNYTTTRCTQCGTIFIPKTFPCKICNSAEFKKEFNTTNSFKVLYKYLQAMGVTITLFDF